MLRSKWWNSLGMLSRCVQHHMHDETYVHSRQRGAVLMARADLIARLALPRALAIAVALAVISAATVVIYSVDPFGWRTPAAHAEFIRARDEYRKQIAALAYTPLDPTSAEVLRSALEASIRGADNSHAKHVEPTEEQIVSLRDTLSAQLIARASPDPDDYIALAESEGLAWLDPDDPRNERVWSLLDLWHNGTFGAPTPRDDPKGALRRQLSTIYERDKSRLTGVLLGDAPPLIRFYTARTPIDIIVRSAATMTDEEVGFWGQGASMQAFRYRQPRRRSAEALAQDGYLTCAFVNVMVETQAGNQYNWESYWFWDTQSKTWVNEGMVRRGWYGHIMFY